MFSALTADEAELARHLVDTIGEAAAAAGRPIWVMALTRPGDPPDLAVAGGDFDPMGWSAPPECQSLAMVATGRVRPLDDRAELPANLAGGRPGGVRMACVLSRAGRTGWHMVLPDGTFFDEVPEEGRVLDVMKRCMDLPTPPPPASIGLLGAYGWLGALLDADPPPRPLGWSEVLDLHPALEGSEPGMDVGIKETVIDLRSEAGDWDDVRRSLAAGGGPGGLLPPDLAAWMDEGMFARWFLGSLRPLEDMLAEIRPRLRPAAARRLAHMVRAAR